MKSRDEANENHEADASTDVNPPPHGHGLEEVRGGREGRAREFHRSSGIHELRTAESRPTIY